MKDTGQILGKYEKSNLESRLMTNFLDSMKDEVFSKLVGKLKLSYEELSKYTTTLEDCSLEYKNCLSCKCLLECKNKVYGHAFLPEVKNGKLRFGYKPCKFKLKEQKEFSYLNNIYMSSEANDIKFARFEDIDVKDVTRLPVIKALTEFIENYRNNKKQKGIYLQGSFGSGKTYLISATFHELAKDGIKGAIIFWPEFLTDLKASFGKDDFQDKLNRIKKSELLLIDDIGAENVTPWSRDDVLCPILQYRMQENLTTFFTSNFTLDALEEHLATSVNGVEIVKSKRIMERIRHLTVEMEMNSENLRK